MPIKWTPARNERLLLLIVKDLKPDATKLASAWANQYGDDDFQPTARAIKEQFGVLKNKARTGANGGGGAAMKGVANGAIAANTHRAPRTPSSNRKANTTKSNNTTPSKRKKSSGASSDDGPDHDDDDDDSELDLKNLPKAIPRDSLARTKKTPKRYEESASASEFGSDGEDTVGVVKREAAVNGTASPSSTAAKTIGLGDGTADDNGGVGEEIHVANPKLKTNGTTGSGGLDSMMRGLMADTGPSPAKKAKVAHKAADVDSESDVSDFAAGL